MTRHPTWTPSWRCTLLFSSTTYNLTALNAITIRYIFPFLFTGRKPTTSPANNCQYSLTANKKWSVHAQYNTVQMCFAANNNILMCKCTDAVVWKTADRFTELFLYFNNVLIKTVNNLDYRQISLLSVSCRSIICLILRLRQIFILFTGKSRYFAQTCKTINKYLLAIVLHPTYSSAA